MLRLQVEGLSYTRHIEPIFEPLNFEVESGQLLAIKGRNGAGKTTLLKLLAGLLEADQGRVQLFEQQQPVDLVEHLAWLGHRNAVKDHLSAMQNLHYLSLLRPQGGLSAIKALDVYGLFDQRHQIVKHFSQGMKRRLALAGLLMSSAKIWLIDEPQASLDQAGIALFEQRLEQHLNQNGMAIIASHHPLSRLQPIELNLGQEQ